MHSKHASPGGSCWPSEHSLLSFAWFPDRRHESSPANPTRFIQYSDQPGARFRSTPNPDYVPALANPEALRRWLNEEVDLVSTTDLFVADATLSGNLVDNVADFAVGYQYRGMQADGDPNDPGDATLNPCAVVGDLGCAPGDQFGPYFIHRRPPALCRGTAGAAAVRRVGHGHRPRVDTQIAANYEFDDVAGRHESSFDPKLGWRLQVAENLHYSLAFRGSVQTTFRTPSLDDLNPSPLTTAEWVTATSAWNVVDRFGRPEELLPERAFTYNAGAVLFLEGGVEATVVAGVEAGDGVVGHRADHVLEVVAPIVGPPCRGSSSAPAGGPRNWRPPTAAPSGTWSASRSTW